MVAFLCLCFSYICALQLALLSGLQYKEVCEWPVWAVFLLN